ncbi:MAG: glycosyl transferase family 2 [Candidatus Altiarchaeales archaeon]|nr:glycosyl transferase family 2 [Candidatus Altiarchaeales archaeon]MBD3417352.1 glycosyl transferase family 2 [Candidatus Altiarchaeales archaeon]
MDGKARKKIREVGDADIVVATPTYNNVSTVAFVICQIARGLERNFPRRKSVILVSDGGSTDGTPEVSRVVKTKADKIVFKYDPYDGVVGKGAAIRSTFEIAEELGAKAYAMIDSDMRSVSPEWMKLLLGPCLKRECDLITPYYSRYKYDGTITNFITHPMTQMLFGKRIRQPIGGDFGLSKRLLDRMLGSPLIDRPETNRFGIDIFMTGTALGEGLKVGEAVLGVKTHDAKDPAGDLKPMFNEVLRSLFNVMDHYREVWCGVRDSHAVKRYRGDIRFSEPEPFEVNVQVMLDSFLKARKRHSTFLKKVFPAELSRSIEAISDMKESFYFGSDLWVDTVYNIAPAYLAADEKARARILDLFCGLWLGRVAYFTMESRDMNNREAEHLIEDQALKFEERKSELEELLCM